MPGITQASCSKHVRENHTLHRSYPAHSCRSLCIRHLSTLKEISRSSNDLDLIWSVRRVEAHTLARITQISRVANRQDFTSNESVGAASQLTDFSRQVGCRSQLMASQLELARLSQASEASQISRPGRGRPAQKRKKKKVPVSSIRQSFPQTRKRNQSATPATNYYSD